MTSSDCYEIRVKGRLSAALQAAFPDMTTQVEPIETVLSGPLEDQAALFGVLSQVQALGLELIEVRHIASSGTASSGTFRERRHGADHLEAASED